MVSFIFGGNTNETPESLKRKREMIEAMIAGQRPPQNWGEGWGAVMKGIASGVLRKRADTAEAAGRQSGDSVYNKITSMITGGTPVAGGTSGLPTGGGTAGNIPMAGAAGELAGTQRGATPDMTGNEVYSGFMDTVRQGYTNKDGEKVSITNPYALAAIAATGKAESGFDPGNVSRTWSDPSESGQAGTAGGIMSWRGPRYQALAATGDLSPAGQARFFLGENPQLIQQLQNAQSVEEAQSLMNNAWKFAGYNRAGGEADRRLKAAHGYLPTFQGSGDVAALTAEDAINAVSPTRGNIPMNADPIMQQNMTQPSLSDEVAAFEQTPEYRARFPGMQQQAQQFDAGRFGDADLSQMPVAGRQGLSSALQASNQGGAGQQAIESQMGGVPQQLQGSQQLMAAQGGMMPALTGGQPASAQQIAQAQALGQQQGTHMSGPALKQLYEAAANPWLSPEQKAIVGQLLEQKLQEQDPSHHMDLQYRRAQIDKLNREAADPKGDETFFGNPVAIQNQDGSISYGQIGNKGSFRPIELGEGQSFAPPTKTIETGTETILMDQAGNVISRTPKQNRQEAKEKAVGAAEGKTEAETRAEYESITSKMPGLYSVVDRLETLAEDATYTMAGKGYDWARSQMGMEPREAAVARAEYTAVVDNQILPLLRDTFGAQFTAEEGQRLARTLGDPDKSPTEKQALLRAFIQQKERDIQGLASRLGGTQGAQTGALKGGRSPVSIGGYTIEEVD